MLVLSSSLFDNIALSDRAEASGFGWLDIKDQKHLTTYETKKLF